MARVSILALAACVALVAPVCLAGAVGQAKGARRDLGEVVAAGLTKAYEAIKNLPEESRCENLKQVLKTDLMSTPSNLLSDNQLFEIVNNYLERRVAGSELQQQIARCHEESQKPGIFDLGERVVEGLTRVHDEIGDASPKEKCDKYKHELKEALMPAVSRLLTDSQLFEVVDDYIVKRKSGSPLQADIGRCRKFAETSDQRDLGNRVTLALGKLFKNLKGRSDSEICAEYKNVLKNDLMATSAAFLSENQLFEIVNDYLDRRVGGSELQVSVYNCYKLAQRPGMPDLGERVASGLSSVYETIKSLPAEEKCSKYKQTLKNDLMPAVSLFLTEQQLFEVVDDYLHKRVGNSGVKVDIANCLDQA